MRDARPSIHMLNQSSVHDICISFSAFRFFGTLKSLSRVHATFYAFKYHMTISFLPVRMILHVQRREITKNKIPNVEILKNKNQNYMDGQTQLRRLKHELTESRKVWRFKGKIQIHKTKNERSEIRKNHSLINVSGQAHSFRRNQNSDSSVLCHLSIEI